MLSAKFSLSCILLKGKLTFDVVLIKGFRGFCTLCFSAESPATQPRSVFLTVPCRLICRLLNGAKLETALFERKWMSSILPEYQKLQDRQPTKYNDCLENHLEKGNKCNVLHFNHLLGKVAMESFSFESLILHFSGLCGNSH